MEPNKELGQNFLVDEDVVDELIAAGEVTKQDTVLEIGSGLGYVTKSLAKSAGQVVAIEIDSNLIHILQNNLGDANNVVLINDDALSTLKDVTNLYPDITKTVSSIPFQITSPLLHQLVNLKEQIRLSALLIQREVAERICAKPPDANYMSIFLGTFLEVSYVITVSKNAFDPVPKVDGAIVVLKTLESPQIQNSEIDDYSKFLHHGFSQQRKMLNKRFDVKLLEEVGIGPQRRAETLSIEEWVKLFRKS